MTTSKIKLIAFAAALMTLSSAASSNAEPAGAAPTAPAAYEITSGAPIHLVGVKHYGKAKKFKFSHAPKFHRYYGSKSFYGGKHSYGAKGYGFNKKECLFAKRKFFATNSYSWKQKYSSCMKVFGKF